MKKSDIAMIILIAAISIIAAFGIANSLPFLKTDAEGVKVKKAEKLSGEVVDPDSSVFNDKAINPTVKTVIGQ